MIGKSGELGTVLLFTPGLRFAGFLTPIGLGSVDISQICRSSIPREKSSKVNTA
jgi:hypothetical protein